MPPENEKTQLEAFVDHVEEDRTEAFLLYELLLKLGLDLCVPIEQKEIAGKTIHAIAAGVLMACLAEEITTNETEALGQGIVQWHKEPARQAIPPAYSVTAVLRTTSPRPTSPPSWNRPAPAM